MASFAVLVTICTHVLTLNFAVTIPTMRQMWYMMLPWDDWEVQLAAQRLRQFVWAAQIIITQPYLVLAGVWRLVRKGLWKLRGKPRFVPCCDFYNKFGWDGRNSLKLCLSVACSQLWLVTRNAKSTGPTWKISSFVHFLQLTMEIQLLWRQVTAVALFSHMLFRRNQSKYKTEFNFGTVIYVYFN